MTTSTLWVKLRILTKIALLLFLLVGCTEPNDLPCEENPKIGVDTSPIFVDDLKCTLKDQNDQDLVTFKIRSKAELEEWLSCEDNLSDFDFEKDFIVGGRFKSYECGKLEEVVAINKCNELSINVTLQPLICGAITDVYFFISLPLTFVDLKLEFDIVTLEP